jgi:hypothetical protein
MVHFSPYLLPYVQIRLQFQASGSFAATPDALTTEPKAEVQMANKKLPDPEVLRKLLDYDPETGVMTWRHRPFSEFPSKQSAKTWHTRYCGKPAFTSLSNGYLQGTIYGVRRSAHRVVWAIYYGRWPEKHIDHINGNKADNRISNLREVTNQQNQQNAPLRKDSTSGVTGVTRARREQRWVAEIYADGRKVCLGYFKKKSDAIKIRAEAEKKYGYHPNHGRHSAA